MMTTRRWLPSLLLSTVLLLVGGAPAFAQLSEYQSTHAQLVEATQKAIEARTEIKVKTVGEPHDIDKRRFREAYGDRTVDRGRAWSAEPSAVIPGEGFSSDLAFESFDLTTASAVAGFFYTPPDTQGAVGPTQFVTTQNGMYRFHDKNTGASLGLDVAASAFWPASVDPSNTAGGDPRVRYDRLTDTWAVIAFDNPPTGDNHLLLAVSDGPVISGSTVWTYYFFTPGSTVDGASLAGSFADYPMFGLDANAYYLGANHFSSDVETAIYVMGRSQLPQAGGDISSNTTAFADLLTGQSTWSPMPADNYDPNATIGYVIGQDANSDTTLRLYKISNPDGAPGVPDFTVTSIAISNKNDGWSSGVPHPGVPAPVAGNLATWGLDPLGFRPLGGAHVRDGRLWLTMTSSVEGPGGALRLWPLEGDRNSVLVFEVDVNSNTLIQDGNVYDGVTARGSDPTHYWMGSVVVSGQGHAVVGATAANASSLAPSAAWAARLASDPLGEFSEPQVYFAGTDTGNMRQSFESSNRPTRWGDYSLVSLDPCDDMTFYTIQEYQDTPAATFGGNWGTAVGRILAPPPDADSANPDVVAVQGSPTTVTVTGSGFYDPPATGMSDCRTELEASTSHPGLVVENVVYIGPTSFTVDLDTALADAGTATIDITNPDGQTTSFDVEIGDTGIFADDFESNGTSNWSETVP